MSGARAEKATSIATLLAVQVLDKHRVTSGARLAVVGHMQVVSTQCVRGA